LKATFFAELKEAWPVGTLSMYVSGNADVRISAAANSAAVTFPFGYGTAAMVAMEPHLDQIVYGGYAALNYTFFDSNTEANCAPNPKSAALPAGVADVCGGINPMQTVAYAVNGSHTTNTACTAHPGNEAATACAVSSWGAAAIPKHKLVFAVGWYSAQHNLGNPAAHDVHIGSQPSFCATVPLAEYPGVVKRLDGSGTWV
jgi:hypothetical protein